MTMGDWNFELTANGTQRFAIKPSEILSIGDYVTIDGATGKLRRMVSGEDITGFAIPPHAEIDMLKGVLVIPDTTEMQKEMTMAVEIEKRPGWDWVCLYQAGDEPTEEMDVFGATSIDEAMRDAHQSLSASEMFGIEPDYQIFAVIRSDHYAAIKGK